MTRGKTGGCSAHQPTTCTTADWVLHAFDSPEMEFDPMVVRVSRMQHKRDGTPEKEHRAPR
jgi:hypothetical protein